MMRSLRIRLILLLGIAIGGATLLQFTVAFNTSMKKADTLFDYHMQQMAMALRDSNFEQPDWYTSKKEEEINFDFVIQVWTDDGVRVYQSRRYRSLPEQGVLGYSTVTLDNGDWRIYSVHTDTRVIQVAQKMDSRRDRAIDVTLQSVWPIIPVSLLLLGAAWWVVTSALAPLNRIGSDLARRDARSLEPVSDAGVPKEVSLLVAELNSLLARVNGALLSQQRFVADAAHELRSPLTALKLQVQTLARARDDAARSQGISRLLGGVDRASRLVEQLLSLAREDPLAHDAGPSEVDLSACVDTAIADVSVLAASRAVRLEHAPAAPALVHGDSESLRIMCRNLLDNAVRYTPEGGVVRCTLSAAPDQVLLCVEDSGPGIPEEDRARVFDRFYRLPGTSPGGSGLGLAIVRAIADRHGADVQLGRSALGGLSVSVRLAPMPSPAEQQDAAETTE
ncbi:ATP-binding protein [Noviherbaspirillum aridicola]|uniref:histidine kinase n=1 Tax=Noviherbaspirillum aridicola TaxID=2849687 RepID=A0ABQ4Q1D9_9BURK|nr:ATP-binding protein [Noviherbaspirillum aridicola]GIZ50827.1 two-component sensor histidine kinase [Noviherbaspirillum aridicola]